MQYPLFAGFKEQTTSREAANAIEASGKAQTLREKVEAFFATGRTGTADEVAAWLGESPFSLRPRISELYQLGLIERTGERRKSSVGRSSHVYRAKVTA
jgi:predicted ArsR family transcriptional regulator